MIVVKVLIRIIRLLPQRFTLRGVFVVCLLLLNSGLEVLGLGAIIPVVLVVVEKGAIESNRFLALMNQTMGSLDEEYFLLLLCFFLMIILVLKSITTTVIAYYQARFTYDLKAFISQNLFRSYYAKGLPYFKKMNSQNVLRNINGVPASFATSVILPLLSLLTELFIISFILIGLVYYDYKVVIILFLVVFPVFGLFYRLAKNKIKFFREELYRLSPTLSKVSFEAIYGFTDVKVTGTEEAFFNKHKHLQQEMIGHEVMSITYQSVPPKVIEFSMFLGVTLIIVYGVLVFDDRSDLIALLGLFALAAYRVLPSINRLMLAIMTIKSYEYTMDVMERDGALTVIDSKLKEEKEELSFQNLEFRNLSFTYDRELEPVLRDVNLEIKKGEVIGVIGESGSGKSTLMNLILGYYPVDQYEFHVNGNPLNQDKLQAWQRSLGYVSQDVFMMDASIKENVAFGLDATEIDEEKVWHCLERASLKKLVCSFEKGIDTIVGERGGLLSGGQKQRIGIARSLYSGAQVLLFDEATSALDTDTEREITESIHKLKNENFTMIIIAHRYTSLSSCDRIIELEKGRIKQEITYDQLLARIT